MKKQGGVPPGVPATNANGHGNQQQCDNDLFQVLLIQLQHQRQQMTGMEQRSIDGSLDSFHTWTRSQFTIINNNIRQFGGSIQGGLARQDPAQALERQAAARNQHWKLINGLVKRGCHVHEAIHMIKEAYGHNCTVLQYIDKMIKDCQNGGHPNLR